jgi:hypothetical protein
MPFIEYAKNIGVRYRALSGDDVAKERLCEGIYRNPYLMKT